MKVEEPSLKDTTNGVSHLSADRDRWLPGGTPTWTIYDHLKRIKNPLHIPQQELLTRRLNCRNNILVNPFLGRLFAGAVDHA